MLRNNSKSGSLLLAGLAAYAYYKYSKMTPDERRSMLDGLKEKGKKLVDQYLPDDIKDKFMNRNTGTAPAKDHFDEGSYYTG